MGDLGRYAHKDLNDKEMRWFYFFKILLKMFYVEFQCGKL